MANGRIEKKQKATAMRSYVINVEVQPRMRTVGCRATGAVDVLLPSIHHVMRSFPACSRRAFADDTSSIAQTSAPPSPLISPGFETPVPYVNSPLASSSSPIEPPQQRADPHPPVSPP